MIFSEQENDNTKRKGSEYIIIKSTLKTFIQMSELWTAFITIL
jgi:hypothetical protein